MLLNSELMKVNLLRENHFWSLWFIISPAGAVAKYCNEYVCLSVGLSVCLRGYLRNHTHDLYQIFYACCLCPWLGPPPTRLWSAASPLIRKGFSSPLKMHYRLGKGDGSAQRGQSMLSTIALLRDQICLMLVNYECCMDEKMQFYFPCRLGMLIPGKSHSQDSKHKSQDSFESWFGLLLQGFLTSSNEYSMVDHPPPRQQWQPRCRQRT